MRYKITRTGQRPGVSWTQYNQGETAANCLRYCFEFCPAEVKARLETFITDNEQRVTFEFDGCVVEVERVR